MCQWCGLAAAAPRSCYHTVHENTTRMCTRVQCFMNMLSLVTVLSASVLSASAGGPTGGRYAYQRQCPGVFGRPLVLHFLPGSDGLYINNKCVKGTGHWLASQRQLQLSTLRSGSSCPFCLFHCTHAWLVLLAMFVIRAAAILSPPTLLAAHCSLQEILPYCEWPHCLQACMLLCGVGCSVGCGPVFAPCSLP